MTEQLAPYIDLHTHHVRSTPDTVELLSCYLSEVDTLPSHDSLYYSVGLHPWQAEELSLYSAKPSSFPASLP